MNEQLFTILNGGFFLLMSIIGYFLKGLINRVENKLDQIEIRLKQVELDLRAVSSLEGSLKELSKNYNQDIHELKSTQTKLRDRLQTMQVDCASNHAAILKGIRTGTGSHKRINIPEESDSEG